MNSQLLIIGAGPGGYTAAFHAADLGIQVTLVEQGQELGGVCLNRGCIPSKALLQASKIIRDAQHAHEIGITFPPPQIELDKLQTWKKAVVGRLTSGLNFLLQQRKINLIKGHASFLGPGHVSIRMTDGQKCEIHFEKCIIATGSQAVTSSLASGSTRVMNSDLALDIQDIPARLLVIGGGYIGLELGSVYQALGSQVSVVEMTDSLLPGADPDLSNLLYKNLKKDFTDIFLTTKVVALEDSEAELIVSLEYENGIQAIKKYDKALIAIGRQPSSEGLGLENAQVKTLPNGFIRVDAHRQTSAPNIYAIGDIAGYPMLAHKASAEAKTVVEIINGKEILFNPRAIPAVVFTEPEIAWCGLSEQETKQKSLNIEVVKFPWSANGRAVTMRQTQGFTKLLIDPHNKHVLGAAIAGPNAGELIAEAALAIETGLSVSDLTKCIHPHPTLSETILEAAENFYGKTTHLFTR